MDADTGHGSAPPQKHDQDDQQDDHHDSAKADVHQAPRRPYQPERRTPHAASMPIRMAPRIISQRIASGYLPTTFRKAAITRAMIPAIANMVPPVRTAWSRKAEA